MCTLSAHLTSFLRISSFLWNLVIFDKLTFFAIKFLELLNKSMSSDNTNESMLPFAIGKPYLQNVYWEGNQVSNSRGFHQIWLSSTQRDIEQELARKYFSPTSFIFFYCELRSYASHVSPLFRTSGNVRTKICSEQNIS